MATAGEAGALVPGIEITGITHGGEGVGRLPEGMAVFVAGTIPGEVVDLEVTDRRKRFAFARPTAITTPSPDRIDPPCPHYSSCGGCDVMHASVERQRAMKTRVVREQLTRLGKLEDPPVEDCLAVGPDTGYRTRARLHADAAGRFGFHAAGTNDVVPIDACLVLAPRAAEVLEAFRDARGVAAMEVRGHDRTGAAAVVIEPGPGGLELPDGDLPVLLRQPDGEVLAFRGDGELTEVVGELTYRFDGSCFFQANTGGADAIVQHVLAAAGDIDGALVWDLYAGVGLLSLPLAAAGAEVLAVEGHARSARWCEVNATDHRLPVEVVTQDVAQFVRDAGGDDAPDVVVLDPPRTGAGEAVVQAIAAQRPAAIVYVACDVAALARDVRILAERGYRLQRAVPLDVFPQTHHVEIVAILTA